MDWSLLGCGASGHVTFAPDEPALRDRLGIATREGAAWRCLRCGTFVVGAPTAGGPAASAPPVRRAEQVRSALILRLFAVERFLRALVAAALAVAVWRFSISRLSLEQAYDQALPPLKALLHDLGFSVEHSKLLGLLHEAFTANSRTLGFIAIGLGGYAVIELIEGVGLWMVKRWGEYFAMIATSLGLPYEFYELMDKVTVLRVVAFVINLGLVLYLVLTKRLFGVRGGRKAYEARLRSESILDAEIAALAAEQDVPVQAAAAGNHAPVAETMAAVSNAAPVAETPAAGPPWPDAEPPAAAGDAAPAGESPAAVSNAAPVAETSAAGPPWPDAEPPAAEASASPAALGEAPAPNGPPPASGEPAPALGEAPAEAEPMDGTTTPVTTETSDADEADVAPLPRRHPAR